MADLDAALEAGASFIVAPIVAPEVIARCVREKVPVFPGAFTPTEIALAWDLGASAVKVFPAGVVGPAYIKAVKAPLSDVKLMPTGGVTVDNLKAWAAAGADAYGVGSPLFDAGRVAAEDWPWIERQCARFRAEYESLAE